MLSVRNAKPASGQLSLLDRFFFSNPKEVALDFQKQFTIWALLLLGESSALLRIQGPFKGIVPNTPNHLVHLREKKKKSWSLFWFLNPKCREKIYQRVKDTWWKESQLTLAMYFLKQDWLYWEFFYCLSLWAPLPQTYFLFPSPHCPVFASWMTVLAYCVFSSLSVLLLFPLLYSCMCTETKCISDNSLLWTWNSHLGVMITLPFTFFFSLHVLIEFLPQPHLVHHVSDSQTLISMLYDRLNGALPLGIQALKN